jgi:hypothetical protein
MRRRFFTVFLLVGSLLLVTAACRFSIPDTETVVLGETRTLQINESLPPDPTQTMKVEIVMGAGKLSVSGGAQQLLEGTVEYNVADWEPGIVRREGSLEVRQGVERTIDLSALDRVINRWELRFGPVPVNLRLTAGAYEGKLDLSGVPLAGLDISDGASDADLVFNQPNPIDMDKFNYRTGASDVNISGLGNANFNQMTFNGGAGSYSLDFSGALRKDAQVTINGGLGDFTITIPHTTAARVKFNGDLTDVNTRGTWMLQDNVYTTSGSGPVLDITVNLGLGSITLESE